MEESYMCWRKKLDKKVVSQRSTPSPSEENMSLMAILRRLRHRARRGCSRIGLFRNHIKYNAASHSVKSRFPWRKLSRKECRRALGELIRHYRTNIHPSGAAFALAVRVEETSERPTFKRAFLSMMTICVSGLPHAVELGKIARSA